VTITNMHLPLQVTFHGLSASESVEEDVRKHLADVVTAFPRLVSCRVSIELPHRHQHQGGHYRVRVEIGVPGLRAVATHAAENDPAHEDVHVAIRDAFRAVRRQLEDQAGRRDHAGTRESA
jgi:ribosome-associated translation inhibitor RaiA